MNEEWRAVPGYEGTYEVNQLGQVRSLERTICDGRGLCKKYPGIPMKPQRHVKGYLVVFFRLQGTKQKHFVHRLVAMAFIPNPESKPIVNHKDGVRHNNHLHNLEWMSEVENTRHGIERRAAINNEPF